MVLAGFATVGALPAAAHPGTVQYVALGDSYAAGQGASPYLNDCLQSLEGYPELLDSEKRIHLRANEACTGATTSEVANTQLAALNRGTRLVTLTVGAADLDVSGVATACLTGTQEECLLKIAQARALLPAAPGGPSVLGSRLVSLFAEVADAAPNARIVVTGYPLLFAPPAPGSQNEAIINQINLATALLNDAIKQAVEATQATGVDIVYVDVTAASRAWHWRPAGTFHQSARQCGRFSRECRRLPCLCRGHLRRTASRMVRRTRPVGLRS